VEAGRSYFDFSASTLDGGAITLSEVVGREMVLLQFWSVSCNPCLEEFPLLSRLQAQYGDLGLQVIGGNIDNGNGGAARLQETLQARRFVFPYPVALDPERTASTPYVPWAVPVTVLIDRSGMARAVHTGYKQALDTKIESEVRDALGM
jgi:peroxiredoxin